jgi:GNAT superfamily N-acetyltransferase
MLAEMPDGDVCIRPAHEGDLPAILALFAADELPVSGLAVSEPAVSPADASARVTYATGASVQAGHMAALEAIGRDPNNAVYVAESGGSVVATLQLTFIQQLSYGGGLVAQIESVHVDRALRSRGIGQRMVEWAVRAARERGAVRVQLTSNGARERAHRFYERLGFRATHKGMKLYLR